MTATAAQLPVRVHAAPPDLERAVEQVRDLPAQATLVWIVSARRRRVALAYLAHARAATVHNRVAVYETALTPVGQSALATMAGELSSRLSAGQLVEALRRLEARMRSVTVFRSVTRLQDPAPSIWQHIGSWWPSTRFAVDRTGVRRISPTAALLSGGEAPPGTEAPVLLAAAPRSAEGQRLLDRVVSECAAAQLLDIEADSAAFWGAAPVLDCCAAPADLSDTVQAVLADSAPCPWCGAPFAGPVCAICHPASENGIPA